MKLTHNASKASTNGDASAEQAQFVCPLTMKEMNGSQPFVYLWTCGCVFSQSGLRAVAGTPPLREDVGKLEKDTSNAEKSGAELEMCPQCGAKYNKAEDIIALKSQQTCKAGLS